MWYATWALGVAYQETTFRTKLAGVRARGASKNGISYLFLQPLKLAISNLVHNFGLGVACRETTFTTKIGGGPG